LLIFRPENKSFQLQLFQLQHHVERQFGNTKVSTQIIYKH